MSFNSVSEPFKQERKGNFFKLIDSFAWEIGTLKKEMGKKTDLDEGDHKTDTLLGLEEEVGGLFLQASPCTGIRVCLPGTRDSGYESLHRRLSVLDRLVHTHAVWLQLGLSHQDATRILKDQPTGTFVVRKTPDLQKKVISLRMDSAVLIKDFPVKESQYAFSLEGSGLSFADLFRLVAFCCISRDVLPFTLKLPEAITTARTSADLEEIAKLGADRVLEKAMHKCVLKPLKSVVSMALQEFQERSGEWQDLKENLSLAKVRKPQEMGVADAMPPDPVAIEKIKHKFNTMCKLYSPEKKVTMLLRVCKLIYTIMEDNSGRLYGADDFLPMLTYVLAQCDMPQLDNEILYMMELLDPSLLHGEGGYYLTSAYGAMSLIRNFQEEQAARVLSSETRDTLRQWHRRRTTQRSTPSIDDFQNYLRVALQELDSGCTAKTLQVRPYATVEEVCQLCAHKFKVSDPENYGLFLLTEGSSQQLAPDNHPQKIKAELHSRLEATPFHFVFRRVANSNAISSAPFDTTPDLNDLTGTSDPQANLNDINMDLLGTSPQPTLSLGLSPALTLSLPPSHLNGNSIPI
uniref:Ras and Rab interactor 2 n=1 Tax=Mastacembelus armatus TaxID=205130 RepID=A0A3Q3LKP6_9TELE